MAILEQSVNILTAVSDRSGYHSDLHDIDEDVLPDIIADLLKDLPTGGMWVHGLPGPVQVYSKYHGQQEAP